MSSYTDEDRDLITALLSTLISKGLKLDLSDPNLAGTPQRIAKMYTEEFFACCNHEFPENDLSCFPNENPVCDEIVFSDKIHYSSICSHHFLPFSGLAWLFYIPNKHLAGASKMSRIVAHYCKRPQLQERLAIQILNRFVEIVKPKGAMIFMRGIHDCMACRGVGQYAGAGLGNSAISGCFKEDKSLELRALEIIKISLLDRR